MKYLFDNCISPNYAAMLSALGVEAVALRDMFSADIKDEDLFASLTDSLLVFVSADRKQQTRNSEFRAIKEAGLTAIWFGPFWGKKTFWDQAIWLVRHWPRIDGYVRGIVVGTCATIKENGKAEPFVL